MEIQLSALTIGSTIGLQITRQSRATAIYGTPSSNNLIEINEQRGTWSLDKNGNPVYTIKIGGSDQDKVAVAIKMPLQWANNQDHTLTFLAIRHSAGNLNIETSTAQIGARTITVVNYAMKLFKILRPHK